MNPDDERSEFTWPHVLTTLLSRHDLSPVQASWVMEEIITGSANEAQIAGFAVAARAKGESSREIAALTEVMLGHATPLPDLPSDLHAVDVVGTGGDGAHTANISTMAAVVVAAAGVPVLKHGSRAASSKCGASDLLAELGVAIDLSPSDVARCVRETGIGFCFAPNFHPGLRHAAPTRRALGIPTVFNFLGPLTNPARVKATAMGCADQRMAPAMAGVLADRNDCAVVMRGEDGLDEFTVTAPTRVWMVRDGDVTETVLDATDLGVARATIEDVRGGDPARNAAIARTVFAGERSAVADMVALNAAVALAVHEGLSMVDTQRASQTLVATLALHLERVRGVLESGAAQRVLDAWISTTQSRPR